MQIRAIQKFVRMSPRKLRLVASLVKDLSPNHAVEVLPLVGKRASEPLRKVIKSAIANAKEKKIGDSDLIFKEINISEGPRLKRFRAGAKGRVKPYQRKMSHIRVVLETKEPESIKKARKKVEESRTSRKGSTGRTSKRSLRSKDQRTEISIKSRLSKSMRKLEKSKS